MENCTYLEINDAQTTKKTTVQRKPLLKQILICSGGWVSTFLYGFCAGGPTVFIPQLRKEANLTNVITDDTASWLTAAFSFSSIPFMIIVPILAKLLGRKISFIISAIDYLAGFIILYCSVNVTHIVISQLVHGLTIAAGKIVLLMIFTEYTSPANRGLFLIVKTTTFYWGVWVSNTIGTFFYWKMIPLFGIVASMYLLFIGILLPESPYWLASRGKFKECAIAHRWLKGCDKESERELETLINSHKKHVANHSSNMNFIKNSITSFCKTLKSKEFYKPSLLALTTVSLTYLCGKNVCMLYALDIIRKITNSESTAYIGMLLLDGVTVVSMSAGCIVAGYLSRRFFILVSSSIGAMSLFILALYLYLITLGEIVANNYVSIVLLTAFSIAVSCGPIIAGLAFYGELVPIQSRSLSLCLIWVAMKILDATVIKNTPFIINACGLHGLFLIFGVCLSTLILILYKYLPETKNKTLQEIADSITGSKTGKKVENLELMESICKRNK